MPALTEAELEAIYQDLGRRLDRTPSREEFEDDLRLKGFDVC